MTISIRILFALGSFLLASGCRKSDDAANPTAPLTGATSQSTPLTPSTHPGLLGEGDVLEIKISDLNTPGLGSAKLVRVTQDGSVPLYYVGAVKIGGMTEADAVAAIAKAYAKANILTSNPAVDLRRLQVGSANSVKPIQPGDLVRLSVADLQPSGDAVRITRVQNDGFIGIWYLGKLKIAGLTEAQAEQMIGETYRKANILSAATVSLFILEPAPPDAAKRDLPDVPLQPIPMGMERSFVTDPPSPAPVSPKK